MIYVLHNESAGMFINKCLPSVNVLTQLEDRRPDMKFFAIYFNIDQFPSAWESACIKINGELASSYAVCDHKYFMFVKINKGV